jgi:hypothetical protein
VRQEDKVTAANAVTYSRGGAAAGPEATVPRFTGLAIRMAPKFWNKLNGRVRLKPSGKSSGRESFKVFK